MFLRRAFSASSTQMGKLHCLAFADSLDYDVGEQTEKDFKKFIDTARTHSSNYFLIAFYHLLEILCAFCMVEQWYAVLPLLNVC